MAKNVKKATQAEIDLIGAYIHDIARKEAKREKGIEDLGPYKTTVERRPGGLGFTLRYENYPQYKVQVLAENALLEMLTQLNKQGN